MKKVGGMLLLVGLCLCFVSPAQAEVQYLGEVCIFLENITFVPEILRLSILTYGTDTYPLYGKLIPVNGGVVPLHGSAVVDGNTATITLNFSDVARSPLIQILTATYSVSIDLLTLSGEYTTFKTRKTVLDPSNPANFLLIDETASGARANVRTCP